jgi:hypothetical protein
MSVSASTIKCSRCNFGTLTSVLWGRFSYEFPDGLRIPVKRVAGWCNACADIVPIECLNIKKARLELENASEDLLRTQVEHRTLSGRLLTRVGFNRKQLEQLECSIGMIEDRINEARLLVNFFASRSETPKCLICSSSQVQEINLPDAGRDASEIRTTGFIHPGCGGVFAIFSDGLRISMGFPTEHIYSPSGVKMRDEQKVP